MRFASMDHCGSPSMAYIRKEESSLATANIEGIDLPSGVESLSFAWSLSGDADRGLQESCVIDLDGTILQ